MGKRFLFYVVKAPISYHFNPQCGEVVEGAKEMADVAKLIVRETTEDAKATAERHEAGHSDSEHLKTRT